MRAWLFWLLSLACAPANAQEGRIEELVERLSSEDFHVRTDAFRRLVAMGEGIIPKLERLGADSPEATRLLGELVRRGASLRLYLFGPSGPQRIGAPVRLGVRLVNRTDETYVLPVMTRRGRRAGRQPIGTSTFLIRLGEGKERRLHRRRITLVKPKGRALVLQPGGEIVVGITLTGDDSPFRKPGRYTLAVVYRADGAATARLSTKNRVGQLEPVASLRLASPSIEIEASGSSARQLDAELGSDDGRRVAAAVRELKLREDDDALEVLRRHVNHPLLRVRAIRRIGQQARPKDLGFLRALAADERFGRPAQLAAIAALGRYPDRREARLRLFSLAQDPELRDAAVQALTHHRAAATIDLFVRLLQRSFRDGAFSHTARGAILKWTGIHVENRETEIAAFEKWWRANRRSWISANRR